MIFTQKIYLMGSIPIPKVCMLRLDDAVIANEFQAYKTSPTPELITTIYSTLDPLIVNVLSKIASSLKNKHHEDYQDIQQQVRLDVYTVLPKLMDISVVPAQVIAIVVKVTSWSFKTHYHRMKNKKPIFVYLTDLNSELTESEIVDNKIFVNSNQFDYTYLNSLQSLIIDKVISLNKYKNKNELILFCINSFFEGRDPSTKLISKRWEESNPYFMKDYSLLLFKMAILSVVK